MGSMVVTSSPIQDLRTPINDDVVTNNEFVASTTLKDDSSVTWASTSSMNDQNKSQTFSAPSGISDSIDTSKKK